MIKLSISLFRVSADSHYIDMIFDCPTSYYMTAFQLTVIDWATGQRREEKYDLSVALDFENKKDLTSWTIRIPLYKLGIDYPAIYVANLKAMSSDEDNTCEIVDTAVCSDVNYVYKCLLDEVVESCDKCEDKTTISDDVIRNYLILYGHTAAMWQRDFSTAEKYFRILSKCFKNCGCTNCGETKVKTVNCGCSK